MSLKAFWAIDAQLFDPQPPIDSANLLIDDDLCVHYPWMTNFKGLSMGVDILRADVNHGLISGNKWYKLRYWLLDYLETQKRHQNSIPLVSYGGSHSLSLIHI